MSAIFNIPGVVWVSLIVAITKWISDSFPDQPWLPAAVVILGALAKLIQVYWPKPQTGTTATANPAPAALGAPQPADGDDYTYKVNQAQQQPARPRRLATFFIG